MTFIKEIFSGSKTFHAVVFLASALFVFVFSTSTSPLYNNLGYDSAIFQAIGKYWAQGYLPYVDMFENKGPLIFLIDAIGYMIYPRSGIMALQVPMMYLTFLFAWRSLGLFLSGKAKFAAALFVILYYVDYSIEGNRTEEWSMPFLMAATYFFLRGLKEEKFSCPPLVGLINGVGFGVCIMLRMMNATPLCLCSFLSAIFLIQARDFKALWQNVLNFCAGAVIICLPFVIYFAAHSALYDMLYGTILFNLNYSAQRENYLLTHLNDYLNYILINFMPLYLLILISVLELIKNKSRLAMSGLFCGAAMLLLMFKLSPYLGYYSLITPMIIIFFAVLAAFLKNFREMWSAKRISVKRMACKVLILIAMIYPINLINLLGFLIETEASETLFEYNRGAFSEMNRLKEIIPPEERNSVMFWCEGVHASNWILTTGIMPCCRFFGNVKAFANVDPNVKREWLDLARTKPAQWIIYSAPVSEFDGTEEVEWRKSFRINRDADVERLLQERYNLAEETEIYLVSFRLYRLKR